jgi:hypothetical protein
MERASAVRDAQQLARGGEHVTRYFLASLQGSEHVHNPVREVELLGRDVIVIHDSPFRSEGLEPKR